MTPSQFRQWLLEKCEQDQWWLCIDGVTEETPLSLSEIEIQLGTCEYYRAQVLHVSKSATENPQWIHFLLPEASQITPALAPQPQQQGHAPKKFVETPVEKSKGVLGCLWLIGAIIATPVVVWCAVWLWIACFGGSVAPASSTKLVEAPSSSGRCVTKEEYGESWAFTVNSGSLYSESGAAIFESGGIKYGLNGTAKGRGYPPIDSIWRMHPKSVNGSMRIDIGPFIRAALENPK